MKMNWNGLLLRIIRLFTGPDKKLTRSRLVGIYLSRMNGKESFATEFQQVRDRRNSRFGNNRRAF